MIDPLVTAGFLVAGGGVVALNRRRAGRRGEATPDPLLLAIPTEGPRAGRPKRRRRTGSSWAPSTLGEVVPSGPEIEDPFDPGVRLIPTLDPSRPEEPLAVCVTDRLTWTAGMVPPAPGPDDTAGGAS